MLRGTQIINLNYSGEGSLRFALETARETEGPEWIVFTPGLTGTINISAQHLGLWVPSNVTIDGRGADITIAGAYGLRLRPLQGVAAIGTVNNIIIHNLKFTGIAADAIGIDIGVTDVWITHCDFSNCGDGLIDLIVQPTDITISWNHFFDHQKAVLISPADNAYDDDIIRVTMHHNFFEGVEERCPRLRFGYCHAANNVIENVSLYGMRSGHQGRLLAENNMFIQSEAGTFGRSAIESTPNASTGEGFGYVRAEGNVLQSTISSSFIAETAITVNEPHLVVPNFSDALGKTYTEFIAAPATDMLRDQIRTEAGWQNSPHVPALPEMTP